MAKPLYHSINRSILPLDERFNAPVGYIPHPARETELLRLSLGVIAKTNPLDYAPGNDGYALHGIMATTTHGIIPLFPVILKCAVPGVSPFFRN